jgi:hypothetical protein
MKAYLELDEPRILQELQPVWLIRFEAGLPSPDTGGAKGQDRLAQARRRMRKKLSWNQSRGCIRSFASIASLKRFDHVECDD